MPDSFESGFSFPGVDADYFFVAAFWYVPITTPEPITCPFIARSRSAFVGADNPIRSASSAYSLKK
jgi:hypothetical protein